MTSLHSFATSRSLIGSAFRRWTKSSSVHPALANPGEVTEERQGVLTVGLRELK